MIRFAIVASCALALSAGTAVAADTSHGSHPTVPTAVVDKEKIDAGKTLAVDQAKAQTVQQAVEQKKSNMEPPPSPGATPAPAPTNSDMPPPPPSN